jgi:hypothetical protein
VPRPETAPTAVESATFAATARQVWSFRLDFANLPRYNPDVTDVVRLHDGSGTGVGGALGPGARYRFNLAEPPRPGRPDRSHPVELWIVEAIEPSLVAAGMSGGNEAYEEFFVRDLEGGGCTATLTLWVTLPEGLPDATTAAAAEMGRLQIRHELDLMGEVLQGPAGTTSVH